ncbi:hypothetical protein ABPG75_010338 [Micractinium tetrahymenae]
MQEMAREQSRSGGARPRSEDTYPFSTLAVWRKKLTEDIGGEAVGEPAEPYRLRLLLEQGKDVEQAVLGCLKDSLFDLHEGAAWGLLSPAFEEQQRQLLVNAAANELHNDKQLCIQLAREHGLLEAYSAALKRKGARRGAVADYERAGELKFGLLVWRANLRRDASLAEDPQELEALCREAYLDVLRLIRRCGSRSLAYWSAQQASEAPTAESKRRLYAMAVQRVQNALRELGESRGLDPATLDGIFGQVSDPDAVEELEEAADAEAQEGEDREGEAGPSAEGLLRGRGRGSSDESETSALGL